MVKLIPGENDLATLYPEIAKEADGWEPSQYTPGSGRKMSWVCREGHRWETQICNRTAGKGCPYCSGKSVIPGENDLATLYPEIAKEADGWDASLLLPYSSKKLDWKCKKNHKWKASVSNRTRQQSGCPYCAGKSVIPGENDLATLYPEIAKEADGWDASQHMFGSDKLMPWVCERNHKWNARISSRARQQSSCPYCAGKLAIPGENDLATLYPEIAKEADGWDASLVTAKSNLKKCWICRKGHKWETPIYNRTQGKGCPYCSGNLVIPGENDLATLYPELIKEVDGWDPTQYMRGSMKKLNWICANGHKWKASIYPRTRGSGCPYCAEYGFNPDKPAWFYLLSRPGEQQFGITNNIQQRLEHHSRNGWREVEITGPHPGEEVWNTERALKKWLKRKVKVVPGTTENWYEKDMSIWSLKALKELSGIETSIF